MKKTINPIDVSEVSAGKPTPSPKVKLISYSIKAVIPTGPYANVQPEIIVQAKTLNDARDYVLPHFDELYERYLNCGDKPKSKITVVNIELPKTAIHTTETTPTATTEAKVSAPEVKVDVGNDLPSGFSPAYNKAKMAIESCKSQEAFGLVAGQVGKSTRLTSQEKVDLGSVLELKLKELQS
jgi:hypothetical protein